MGYKHADAYRSHDDVELVACADRNRERAVAFAREYEFGVGDVYESHGALLAAVEPDVLSVTVQPASHERIVRDAIDAGVEAIHCEKPMARTVGGSRGMAERAANRGVQLTFNHQRRYGRPFRTAKRLLDDGEVGALERVEFGAANLYDYGSHSFDLCNYYNDETAADWVLAGLDYHERDVRYGVHNENQAIVQWEYANGVDGFAATGAGRSLVGCHNRLVGTDGVIEIGPEADPGVDLRVRRDGAGWEPVETGEEGLHDPMNEYVRRAVVDAVDSLDAGRSCELHAGNALNATELIFGAWESVRRNGRVTFPLDVDDNPLESMVEAGELTPASTSEPDAGGTE
ncbi:Gfo/Idh/MocA family protein [Halorarum halobium]|uniref:Gfo/Idh/MocA family protein n=1 Tax=Halorarum halobium TaxID=3075121 RepID=UPI0028AA9018|nr:Gfo/Idh/MocA family oxidoreductase [Halobaculum sp. XH14]